MVVLTRVNTKILSNGFFFYDQYLSDQEKKNAYSNVLSSIVTRLSDLYLYVIQLNFTEKFFGFFRKDNGLNVLLFCCP